MHWYVSVSVKPKPIKVSCDVNILTVRCLTLSSVSGIVI